MATAMFETNRAGHDARTDPEAPPTEKYDGHNPSPNAPSPPTRPNGGGSQRFPELPDFQRDILLTLARSQPTHGQGLRDDLGSLRDEDVNDGRLYPNLNTLVDLGLVEKRKNVHDDRSHEYVLTDAGRTSVRAHAQRVAGAADALDQEVA